MAPCTRGGHRCVGRTIPPSLLNGVPGDGPGRVHARHFVVSVPSGAIVYRAPSCTKAIRGPSGDQVGQRLSPSFVVCWSQPPTLTTRTCPGCCHLPILERFPRRRAASRPATRQYHRSRARGEVHHRRSRGRCRSAVTMDTHRGNRDRWDLGPRKSVNAIRLPSGDHAADSPQCAGFLSSAIRRLPSTASIT